MGERGRGGREGRERRERGGGERGEGGGEGEKGHKEGGGLLAGKQGPVYLVTSCMAAARCPTLAEVTPAMEMRPSLVR